MTSRVSRKDKHEHRSLCRLLPFVGLHWCQRKEDHSNESREGVYIATSPDTQSKVNTAENKASSEIRVREEKRKGMFGNFRSALVSFFSFSASHDRREVVTSTTIDPQSSAKDTPCNDASAACESSLESVAPVVPSPADLLNHSNYSAFTRAPARLPDAGAGEAQISCDGGIPPTDTLNKEALEVLATEERDNVELLALGCRSPAVVPLRALPPVPKATDGTESPHPPIPPPLPRAVLSAVNPARASETDAPSYTCRATETPAISSRSTDAPSSSRSPDAPPLPSRSTEALPLPSRSTEGPPLPSRSTEAPPLPACPTESASSLPTRTDLTVSVGRGDEGCHFASMIEKVKDVSANICIIS